MKDAKGETQKQKLRDAYAIPAVDKLLNRIELFLMSGGFLISDSVSDEFSRLVTSLDRDFGVTLSFQQVQTFLALFMELNNTSNLWLNCGWKPNDLFRSNTRSRPTAITAGPNMKRLFQSGQLDEKEFEQTLAEMGIKFIR